MGVFHSLAALVKEYSVVPKMLHPLWEPTVGKSLYSLLLVSQLVTQTAHQRGLAYHSPYRRHPAEESVTEHQGDLSEEPKVPLLPNKTLSRYKLQAPFFPVNQTSLSRLQALLAVQ